MLCHHLCLNIYILVPRFRISTILFNINDRTKIFKVKNMLSNLLLLYLFIFSLVKIIDFFNTGTFLHYQTVFVGNLRVLMVSSGDVSVGDFYNPLLYDFIEK